MTDLKESEIIRIARRIADANLSSSTISSVHSEPMIGSEGQEMLRIRIILTPGSTDTIKGDAALNTLVEIRNVLQGKGEERFPVVEYATEEELQESGGS
jgi:hypothetical protein